MMHPLCTVRFPEHSFEPGHIDMLCSGFSFSAKGGTVYGTGENVRDWLHVYDHCSGIDLVMRNGEIGEVYNIGGHNEKHNIEVVKEILKALGKPESLITYVSDRKGHDLRYAIDPTKIETKLGWKPKYTFETGIKETIEWFMNNQEWMDDVTSGDYLKYYEQMYQ